MAQFLLMNISGPEEKQIINLIRDAEGHVLERTVLGLMVEVKKAIGNRLGLVEVVNTRPIEEVPA